MTPEWIGVAGILLLFVLLLLEVPVGLALFLVGFLGVSVLTDWSIGLAQLGSVLFSTVNNYNLSIIPMFVLMGMFMTSSGLAKDLYNAVDKWIGHFRGGLAMATIGAAAIFSAISGSTNATTATLAKVAIPEMQHHRYKISLSSAAVAAGGTLGVLIPPSLLLVMYGAITTEAIGPLLIGGLVPGLLMMLAFMLTVNFQVRLNPDLAPAKTSSAKLRERIVSLKNIWPFLLIFAMSIGGIYFGVFTPTEAGAIGACGAFILTILSKRLNWKFFNEALDDTIRLSVMLFLILIGASLFSKFLALSRLPMDLVDLVSSLSISKYVVLALIIIVYIILGMFMEGLAILVLTVPIVYPVITHLGFSGLWFGVLLVVVLNIGLLTPPVGLSVYIISGIVKDVPIQHLFKAVFPMVITMALFTVLLCIFPEIVTFLPDLMAD